MFHNYFFIKRLAQELNKELIDFEFLECFSQNKDELILGFTNPVKDFYIKATLESSVSLLYFDDDFKRAKRNSVDLFSDIIGLKVSSVSVFQFERSFAIHLENDWQLIFKMHGSRSNILLAKDNKIINIFRHNLPQDLSIVPSELNKPDPNRALFEAVNGDLKKFLPALGKEAIGVLFSETYNLLRNDDKWNYFQQAILNIEENPISIISRDDEAPILTLLEDKADKPTIWQSEKAIEAASKYYLDFTRDFYLNHRKRLLLKEINNKIRQSENYLKKTWNRLDDVKNQRSYEEIANIIMANLHHFQAGKEKTILHDFYNEGSIEVTLKPNVSPQKRAEQLYRKSKNQKIEIAQLEENLLKREEELEVLQQQKNEVEATDDIKSLRALNPKNSASKEDEYKPYHYFEKSGYEILIGKNAKANDILTTKIAHKNDLWLHAKDVSGSHVIIRNASDKTIPRNILEIAAELAAWFSKRRTDSLCPVMYTPRKFVRKMKGTAAGMVRVDKEKVVMVTPKNHTNQ